MNDLTTTQGTSVTTTQSVGMLSQDDLEIPRLHLVQDMSKYYRDKGCEVGTIVESLECKAVATPTSPVTIIPISLAQFWGEVPKKRGSGARTVRYPVTPDNISLPWGDFMDEEGVPRRRRKEYDWLCLIGSDLDGLPAVLTLRDTSFPTGKKLNTFAKMNERVGKAPYHTAYELVPSEQTNDQGSFYVFTLGKKRTATEEEVSAAMGWAGTKVDSKEDGEEVPF